MWFCGIDIGTTHVKVIGIDEDGAVHHPLKEITPTILDGGRTYHTGETMWASVQRLVLEYSKTVMKDRGALAAVSVGTFGQEESIAVDGSGNTVYPSLAWWEVRKRSYLRSVDADYLDSPEHYKLSGLRNRAIQSPERMAFIQQECPNAWNAMRKWVDFGSLVLFRITGEWVFASNQANHSQFFNAVTCEPDPKSLGILHLDPSYFPRIVHTGRKVGLIDVKAFPGIELAEDATAYVGGHDQVLAIYSQRGQDNSRVFDAIGTSEYLMVLTAAFNAAQEAWKLGIDIERGWGDDDFLYGYATPSGKIIQTMANLLYDGNFDSFLAAACAEPVKEEGFDVRFSDFSGIGSGLFDLIGIPASATASSVSRSVFDHLASRTLEALTRMCTIAGATLDEVTLMGSLFRNESIVSHRRRMWNTPLRVSDLDEPVATGAAMIAHERYVADH